MLKVIRSLLLKIVDDIDAGNSNITEGEAIEIVDNLRRFTDKEKRLSKYAACKYLNVSRATFDNYVRGASLVAVNSRRGSSIVHEAEHIKNHIWQYIGYTPQRDNDEVDAYLLTYIYDKITQVFYKHKDNKE